jgi:hypothetical protein
MRTAVAVSLLLLLVLLFSVSCASAPAAGGADGAPEATAADRPLARGRVMTMLRDTAPRSGVPVFAGFSPRLRDRDEEEAVALTDAAREAVRYLEVRASVVFIAQQSGRDVGYAEAVEPRIDEARVEAVREGLELLESIRDEDGTAVLVAAPDLPGVDLPPLPGSAAAARPAWLDARPALVGYDVGVGIARRLRSREDSVTAADEEALAEIVLARAARVRAVEDAREVEGVGTQELTTRAQEAADVVRGFYVLSRARSADGRYYYTLAVARRPASRNGE